MKHTVTEVSDKDDDAKKHNYPQRNTKMQIIFRELCFMLIVLLTAYATIIKSNSRTKKSPPSTPFLENANINDFYKGDLTQLMKDVSGSTYSFIFFYAPWDADCQDLKNEFIEAAEFYVDQIYFAGVNCWEPGSECRARFKNVVERYPQLVAYIGLERAVEYRGPHKADHMIKFLNSVIHPLTRLNSIDDVLRIRHLNDAALIGFLNIHGVADHGLSVLHETSLSLASHDHVRQIAIGVFTHTKFNELLNVTVTPSVHFYIWNKKFIYEGPLKKSSLLKWVMEISTGKLVSTKGLLFLKPPVVVMFSPMHPLALLSQNYLMLQRVAMSLLSNSSANNLNCTTVEYNSSLQHSYYLELVKKDADMRRLCSKKRMGMSGTCAAVPRWHNLTCRVQYKPRRISLIDDSKRISDEWLDESCRLIERTAPLQAFTFSNVQPPSVNLTFTFASLDSSRFEHLAHALGIDIMSEPSSTVVVIIGEEEMVKIGRGELREERLWLGLQQWSQSKTKRGMITGQKDRIPLVFSSTAADSNKRIQLPEIELRGFSQLLQQNKKHSLILYYSQYCGSCSHSALTLLKMFHLLADAKCLLMVRIDGDRNDLPWHFSLHYFPSLLFLPAVRKAESRLFPSEVMWNFSTVSQFLLANLAVEERPEVMLALCAAWGQNPDESKETYRCVGETRKMVLDGIDSKLHDSRRYPNNRKSTLQSLAFLKAVHLSLSRVVTIEDSLNDIRTLSRQYGIGCSVS